MKGYFKDVSRFPISGIRCQQLEITCNWVVALILVTDQKLLLQIFILENIHKDLV